MDIPKRVRAIAEERQQARADRNFILADALRETIGAAGWQILDQEDGYELVPTPVATPVAPSEVPSALDQSTLFQISLHLLHEGHLEDLARFLFALRTHHDLSTIETVVVDPATGDLDDIVELLADVPNGRVVALDRDPGWAVARNAGLTTARGDVIVLADLSIEPTGDVLTPLLDALRSDTSLPLTGPVGAVTGDLKEWSVAASSVCDAIEGYLLATRREQLKQLSLLDQAFTWYRNADLFLSLQLREEMKGAPARITPVPYRQHEHRGYAKFPDDEARDRQSRKNYRLLLDRFRNARHLLSGAPAAE